MFDLHHPASLLQLKWVTTPIKLFREHYYCWHTKNDWGLCPVLLPAFKNAKEALLTSAFATQS